MGKLFYNKKDGQLFLSFQLELSMEMKNFLKATEPNFKFKMLKEIEKIILETIGKPKLTWISSKTILILSKRDRTLKYSERKILWKN